MNLNPEPHDEDLSKTGQPLLTRKTPAMRCLDNEEATGFHLILNDWSSSRKPLRAND